MITSCFFFSVLAGLIKFISTIIHPVEQAFFRNLISAIILSFFLLLKKDLFTPKKSNFNLLFLRAVVGGITMILLFWSYTLIPLSQSMAISFSTPLFICLGGHVLFKETMSRSIIIYIILGFLLTVVIIRPDISLQIGTFFALAAAITHAITGLLVKKLSFSENVFTLMFSMVFLMTPITFVPSLFVWEPPNNTYTIIMLILIALCATLGNYCWTKSISLSQLKSVMPFDFTKLLFSTLIGFIFFNEEIDKITILCGSALILINSLIARKITHEENFTTNN